MHKCPRCDGEMSLWKNTLYEWWQCDFCNEKVDIDDA